MIPDFIFDLIMDCILNLIWYIIWAILVKTMAKMIALHFQVVLLLWVWCFWWWWWFSWLLVSLFDWIEITNCSADSIKVGFNDGVEFASSFQRSDVQPCFFLIVVLEHLKTRKIWYDQIKITSSLLFLQSYPPVTTTCWFKWAALRPLSPLGKIKSTLNKQSNF